MAGGKGEGKHFVATDFKSFSFSVTRVKLDFKAYANPPYLCT